MKEKIKKTSFLKLAGLLTLAEHHYKKIKDIEKSIAHLLNEVPDESGYYGHISDTIWGMEDWDAVKLLNRMGIEIDKAEINNYFDGEQLKNFASEDEIKERLNELKIKGE